MTGKIRHQFGVRSVFIRESVYEIKMCVDVQLGIEDVYLIE